MSQKNSVGRPCIRKFPSAKSQDGPPHCLKERFFEIFENFVRRRREFARHKAKQEPGSIQEGDPSSDSASERPPWRALLRSSRKLPFDSIEQFPILPALGHFDYFEVKKAKIWRLKGDELGANDMWAVQTGPNRSHESQRGLLKR
jgi:hypothetical protein